MEHTVNATVVLLKDKSGRICLAPKKGKIHKGGESLDQSQKRWNGYGGKQEVNEMILTTAIRELNQESGVTAREEDLDLVARIGFFWPGNISDTPSMMVYFFFLSEFTGSPSSGEEMGDPEYFLPSEIPYHEMMPADRLFFPKIISGEKIVWNVHFGDQIDSAKLSVCELNEELALP